MCALRHIGQTSHHCDQREQHHFERSEKHHIAVGDASFDIQANLCYNKTKKGGGKMKTESKNILTRENCKAELKRLSKSRLMQDSVVLAVLLLIFVPLFLLYSF